MSAEPDVFVLDASAVRGSQGDAWLWASALLQEICQLPIRAIPSGDRCGSALSLAGDYGMRGDDALYLALSLGQQACLITADQQLQQVAQRCGCVL